MYSVILGGTRFQEPLVKASIKNNLIPIIFDKNSKCYLANKGYDFIQSDISDPKECLLNAKKFDSDKIIACVTAQSDIGVPSQGLINSSFGLKGVSFDQAVTTSNKLKFRELLASHFIEQPLFARVGDVKDVLSFIKSCPLPIVIKPCDSSGSRGFSKITDASQIQEALTNAFKFTRCEYLLAEEFVDGTEYGAQSFSIKGEIIQFFPHTDWTVSNIPVGHCIPTDLKSSVNDELLSKAKDALKAIGHTGPSNIDFIITSENKVYILEIGARIGATGLPDLIEAATGIDLFDLQIQSCIDENFSKDDCNPSKNLAAGVRILSSSKGFAPQQTLNKTLDFFDQLISKYSLNSINLDFFGPYKKLTSGVDRFGQILVTRQENVQPRELEKLLDVVNQEIINYLQS